MSLLLTTTVTTTIPELNDTTNTGAVFTHPTTNFDLLSKWDAEDIRGAAATLSSEVSAGNITITYNGSEIRDFSLFGLGVGRTYFSIRSVAVSTITTYDDEIVVFTGGASQTITLPDPAGWYGKAITVKNLSVSDLIVDTAGGANIDGFTSVTILGNLRAAIEFVSDGTNWIGV